MGLSQGSAENGKVLAENAHLATVDGPVTRNDAIPRIFRVSKRSLAGLELVKFLKRTFIKQKVNAFPGAELVFLML